MPAFLADENFGGNIVRGLRRQRSEIDIIRVQDINLSGEDDRIVLERVAQLGRVLLTHDAATIPEFAYTRIGAGQPMTGVVIIKRSMAISQAIEEILLLADFALPREMDGQIQYLPW